MSIKLSKYLLQIFTTGIIKKLLKAKRDKNKKHKVTMLARSKLNITQTLISQVLIDLEIGHAEYKTIINEGENYRRLKENNGMMKGNDELNQDKKIETNKIKKENSGN